MGNWLSHRAVWRDDAEAVLREEADCSMSARESTGKNADNDSPPLPDPGVPDERRIPRTPFSSIPLGVNFGKGSSVGGVASLMNVCRTGRSAETSNESLVLSISIGSAHRQYAAGRTSVHGLPTRRVDEVDDALLLPDERCR